MGRMRKPNQPDRGQPRPALGFAEAVMTISTIASVSGRHLTGRGASSGGRWADSIPRAHEDYYASSKHVRRYDSRRWRGSTRALFPV